MQCFHLNRIAVDQIRNNFPSLKFVSCNRIDWKTTNSPVGWTSLKFQPTYSDFNLYLMCPQLQVLDLDLKPSDTDWVLNQIDKHSNLRKFCFRFEYYYGRDYTAYEMFDALSQIVCKLRQESKSIEFYFNHILIDLQEPNLQVCRNLFESDKNNFDLQSLMAIESKISQPLMNSLIANLFSLDLDLQKICWLHKNSQSRYYSPINYLQVDLNLKNFTHQQFNNLHACWNAFLKSIVKCSFDCLTITLHQDNPLLDLVEKFAPNQPELDDLPLNQLLVLQLLQCVNKVCSYIQIRFKSDELINARCLRPVFDFPNLQELCLPKLKPEDEDKFQLLTKKCNELRSHINNSTKTDFTFNLVG